MTDFVFIYGLIDIRQPYHLRYVGKTNDLRDRYLDHISEKKNEGDTTRRANWIRLVLREKSQVGIVLLKKVKIRVWKPWEIILIAKYKKLGHDLTNSLRGGDGYECGDKHPDVRGEKNGMWRRTHTKEVRAILRKKSSHPMLQEIKDKISKKMMGENNPFYNKTHTKETREHLSRIKYKKVGKFDLKGNLLGEFESLKSAQESMPI